MRKILITFCVAFAALFAKAQSTPHAIGVHFGGATIDLEYQYHFNSKNFLDVTAGVFDLDEAFTAQAIYNWNIKQWPDWTPNFATWKFWGGAGAGVGICNNFMVGPVGTLGFGFTLKDAPLTVGVDYRPWVALTLGNDSGLNSVGFRNIGLTLTYRF